MEIIATTNGLVATNSSSGISGFRTFAGGANVEGTFGRKKHDGWYGSIQQLYTDLMLKQTPGG